MFKKIIIQTWKIKIKHYSLKLFLKIFESITFKLCLVPKNLRENIRERKYKWKVERKKK